MGKKLTRFSELSREMKAVEKSFEAVIPKDALIVVRGRRSGSQSPSTSASTSG